MTSVIMFILALIAVGEAAGWFLTWLEKEHWLRKFLDARAELYPWDYTREGGWRDGLGND